MTPDQAARWKRLKGDRRTSDFVRHLLDLEEHDAREREGQAALARLIEFQKTLPPEWKDEAYYDLDAPDDVSPIPPEIIGATFDMREVMASWQNAEEP